MEQQLCLACNVNPATNLSGDTVPLCSDCAARVTDRRGVTYADADSDPKDAEVPEE